MKLIKFFAVILSVISLTSCELTEEITFYENGNGNYDFKIDMSGMVGMMASMKDSTDNEVSEKVDTIMNIKDLIAKDSEAYSNLSAAEKESYNAIKDMKMKMKMDEEAGIMVMNFILDFANVSDLVDMQKKIELAQSLQDNKKEQPDPSNQKVTYSFSKKEFARKVELIKLNEEEQAKFDEIKENAVMFLGSPYKIKYNFPKKIKSTSIEGAVISEDGKSFTYETTLETFFNNPKALDFVIKF